MTPRVPVDLIRLAVHPIENGAIETILSKVGDDPFPPRPFVLGWAATAVETEVHAVVVRAAKGRGTR